MLKARIKRWTLIFLHKFSVWFGLYLALSGLVTFNLFILEEAFQTVMFSTWAAQDAKEWRLVKRASETMEDLHGTLVTMNNIGGWINPFGYVAYRAYATSEREYIDALRSKIFANAPELFDGERIVLSFMAAETEIEEGRLKLRNGPVTIITDRQQPVYTGIVQVTGSKVIVDTQRATP